MCKSSRRSFSSRERYYTERLSRAHGAEIVDRRRRTYEQETEPSIDPRGLQERPILKLAPRVTHRELKKGKILFYNNTKLDFCNYGETFVRIKERFREMGITNFVDYKETVRGKDSKVLEDYAAMLAKEKPTAAVLALGDMGTSPATCIVTIALEKLGIPSVYITAPPGGELVEGVAVYRAGNLCLCKIDIYQASTKEEIASRSTSKWDYIIRLPHRHR